MVYLLLVAIGALAGFAVAGFAAVKPKHVWLLLVAVSIITSGMMPLGYTFVDEYLTGCFLFGVFMYLACARVSFAPDKSHGIAKLHRFFFSLMIAYMIVQAFRGLIVLESLRKVRWVVFYSMLGILGIFLRGRGFTIPSSRRVTLTVTLSGLIYFLLFGLSGFAADLCGLTTWFQYGVGRWAIQTNWWGSSAYSMLPVAVVVPASLISLTDTRKWHRRAGWCTLFLLVVVALYFDSRVGVLATLAFFVVALPAAGIRRSVGILFLCIVTLCIFHFCIWSTSHNIGFFLEDLFGSGSALWRAQKQPASARDIDRWIHMQVAFNSIGDHWAPLLFGYGLRIHGRIISPRVFALYKRYLPELASRVREVESTEGFTALVVDTGIVGLLLVATNFVLVAWQVWHQKRNKCRYILLLSVIILFLWLFVINMLDITLFYLAVMPSGLLLQMARSPDEKTLCDPSLALASHRRVGPMR